MRRGALAWGLAGLMVLALGAAGWMSAEVLRLEDAEALARVEAESQERANLALWRMDLALARLVTEESVRPVQDYRALATPARLIGDAEAARVASPLLERPSPDVFLHFEIDPAGRLTSPEAPSPGDEAALSRAPDAPRTARSRRLLEDLRERLRGSSLLPAIQVQAALRLDSQRVQGEADSRAIDFARRNAYAMQNAVFEPESPEPALAAMTPLWIGDALLLTRRVTVNGEALTQGCWLDWEAIRRRLLSDVADLLPQAGLVPLPEPGSSDALALASLPAKLIPGAIERAPATGRAASLVLAAAWALLLAAVGGIALLVRWALLLGERQAAFASAVTHELRTPLTTFRVYAEMLEAGMVPVAERASYLCTLRREADRLSRLVENVLAFARVERRRLPVEPVPLAEVFVREGPRLAERAEEAGMALTLPDTADLDCVVTGEPTAIGQILFNLVDNACKYAAGSGERRIAIEARRAGWRVEIAVQDFGPGLSATSRKRLFEPFSRSSEEAAGAAPGVGLGLALSRRMAGAMGGGLRLAESPRGARFVLTLVCLEPAAKKEP